MGWTKTDKSYSPWNQDVYQDVGRTLQGKELLQLLEQCCAEACTARLSLVGSDEAIEALFSQVDDEVLVMECAEPVSYQKGETLMLRFDSGRDMVCRTVLRGTLDDEGSTLLKLRLPHEISSADSRRDFRVPTVECLDMVARFEFEGAPHEGLVLDVGNGGLCADLLSAGSLNLKRGDRGRLLLKYQEVWTESDVEVRDLQGTVVHLMYVKK